MQLRGPLTLSLLLYLVIAMIPEAAAQTRRSAGPGDAKSAASKPDARRGERSRQPAKPEPPPEPPADPRTILGTFQRLSAKPADQRSRDEAALHTACDLVLALGRADGDRAAALLDAVGYQPLPNGPELPLDPPRPISVAQFREYASRRATFDAGKDPIGAIEVREPKDVRALFPAVAAWALPTDRVVILRTPETGSDWGGGTGCIVVRTRGTRTVILGGTFFAAAANVTPPPSAAPNSPSPLPRPRGQ